MNGTSTAPDGPRRLYRSRTDRKILGVIGGLGAYFGIDPTLLRVVVVVFTIFTVIIPTTAAYLVCALLIPEEPQP